MVTFEWRGTDRDGVIVGYEYTLYGRSAGEWSPVASAATDPGETSVLFGPIAGLHRFEVWSIDDAGAHDTTPATSTFTCNPELAGSKLRIGTNVFGVLTFRGPVWNSDSNTPIPIFAGERLSFEWIATAEDYGGEVLGYRHAYDDTSVWPAWSIYDHRFDVVPEPGQHSLYVSAIDNANEVTRGRVYFDVVEANLDQYILVVDDYDKWEHQESWGTDDARTEFWEPSQHMVSGEPQPPHVDALRGASTVIWYCDQDWGGSPDNSMLAKLFNDAQYNALAGYMRVGGNLVLCGYKVLEQILRGPYPIQLAETDTMPEQVFVRDFLHIGYAENSGSSSNKSSPWAYGYCFYGAEPTDEELFTPMYVDSVGPAGFPDPGKWPMYADSRPAFTRSGLPIVEKLEVFQGSALEIMTMKSYLNMNYEGRTCGVLYLSGENHGNVCYLGFPLYYLQADHVQPVMDKILVLFGEERL